MDDVAQVRERTDVIALIQEYVPLTKAGRNFKANCPFHSENTPSFMVSPERQMFHCFGCHKGGDVFSFLMEYEHMEFPEALRFLAKRAGVKLTERPQAAAATSKKEALYRVNRLALAFYQYLFLSHAVGKKAKAYVEDRGVNIGVMKTFQLGFAPGSGTALVEYLTKKKGVSEEDIVEAGLAFRRYGRLRDFFTNRLLFPLVDHRDNVVGFSGRILTETTDGPKYINTRETMIYHKAEHFFGINIAKEQLRTVYQAIIVEGEFDVFACFQEGFTNTLALKGTALTDQQVRLLKRYVKKVTLLLDDDKAGQDALVRSLPVLERHDMTTTVILLSRGKDPSDAVIKDKAGFLRAMNQDVSAYDAVLEKAKAAYDMKTAQGKKEMSDFLLPLFAIIHNQIVKEHYLRKLSSLLETSYESLEKELARYEKPTAAIVSQKPRDGRSRDERLELYLLALLLQSDKPLVLLTTAKELAALLPKTRASQKLLHEIFAKETFEKAIADEAFVATLPEELVSVLNTAMLYPLREQEDAVLEKEVSRVTRSLLELYGKKRLSELMKEIAALDEKGEDASTLQQEYQAILRRLRVE